MAFAAASRGGRTATDVDEADDNDEQSKAERHLLQDIGIAAGTNDNHVDTDNDVEAEAVRGVHALLGRMQASELVVPMDVIAFHDGFSGDDKGDSVEIDVTGDTDIV